MKSITKSDFRKKCIKKLKFCSKTNKIKTDKSICKKIEKIIKFEDVRNVLFYLPLEIEVDVRALLNKLRKEKKYNIKEPNNSNFKYKVNIDLAIVPIIGTDNSKRRVGYGVGFYDRYFASIKNTPKVIFTQRCLCKATDILTLNHDIKADYIVTA